MHDKSVTRVLLDLLEEKAPQLRSAGALALGKLGDPAGVARLKDALEDPELAVRSATVQALAEIGGKEAVAALGQKLLDAKETQEIRVNAAFRLGRMERSLATRWLRQAVSDPSLGIRAVAAIALAQQGAREAIPVLVEVLRNEAASEWLVDKALIALRDLTRQDFGYPKKFFAPATTRDRETAIQKWIEWWEGQKQSQAPTERSARQKATRRNE